MYSEYITISGATKPSNMASVNSSSTSNSVTLSWAKNDSATGYFIQQYKNGEWTHLRQLARNTVLSYTATGLAPSTTYQYRIRAYYINGGTTVYSDYTNVSVTTKPSNMTGVKVSTSLTAITLSWDKNDSATGYFIQQYKNGEWTDIRQLARNTVTTYTAAGLALSTTYQYRIRAYFTVDGTTLYSDYTTISGKTGLGNMSGVKLNVTSDTATLSWDKNDNATGYIIQQYKNGEWTHIRQLARNTVLSYTTTGLAPSTNYQYRIRAYYTSGDTTIYSDYTAASATTLPKNMTGVKVSTTASGSVTLSWDKNDSATGYFIQQYKNGTWTHVRQLTRNTVLSHTATGLAPSTTYQFRIRAYYTSGDTTVYSDYMVVSGRTCPADMTGVKVTSTADTVTLSWDKNDTATGYLIQQYKNGTWTHIRQLTRNTVLSYTATGLAPSTTYQFRIRAYEVTDDGTLYGAYTTISGETIS